MKRILFLALLTLAFGSATIARELVAEGKTHSALGDYRIETADNPVIINGEELKTFIITYQNSPMEVKIVVQPGKHCRNYIVLSDKLAVQYVCKEKYFGVQMLDRNCRIEGFTPSATDFNRREFFHQKKLASGGRQELENTMLIAAYFPMLLTDS